VAKARKPGAGEQSYRAEVRARTLESVAVAVDHDYDGLVHRLNMAIPAGKFAKRGDGYDLLREAAEAITRLRADQQDWRKGVALIASALGDDGRNLSCARISELALEQRAALERLGKAPTERT